ncbi:polyribonucleotide nucleotidyltransferase [Candidatus Margulisiibacteriota bacterium]
MKKIVEKKVSGRNIILETGNLAKQANGSVVVKCGNTVMLATATMSKQPRENIDFFPLTVEYSEKMYSAGKFPGGFFKREGRPTTDATLTARLIDRPIRPSFPEGLFNEVQVVITILSYDDSFAPEFLSILGASAALSVSDIPFNGPLSAALVGYVNGELKVNPTSEELEVSTLNMMVAGTKDAILMVEAGANEVSEEVILKAITLAHSSIKESIQLQEELIAEAGKEKKDIIQKNDNTELKNSIISLVGDKIENNLRSGDKKETEECLAAIEAEVLEKLVDPEKENEFLVKTLFKKIKKEKIRATIINEKIRPDGRGLDEIRKITSEVGLLPVAHGSAVFTRGETQSLAVTTLGSSENEQIIDGLRPSTRKKFYLHYNFPPFSVGEVGRMGGTGRRELGHGALAERALQPILPECEDFPYTIRIVSEILESNGSSSMASVCGGSLSLMDAGIPIKSGVSGIAMGLLLDGDEFTVLSDIQGLEDHYGDMDFKVAGTKDGVTALQLDIKVAGLTEEILKTALMQAQKGRLEILDKMNSVMDKSREELSPYAPKIEFITINPAKVGLVIGPGGKMIRRLEEESGASIIITDGDTGQVSISTPDSASMEKAKNMIQILVKDVEIGDVYEGKVVKITNFGAFVELVPGTEALLHISAISKERVNNVEDVLKVGQIVTVKVKGIDDQKRVSLTMIDV